MDTGTPLVDTGVIEDLGAPDTGPVDLGEVPDPDMGAPDTGLPRDLGPPDTGVVDLCAPVGSRCVEARACGTERPAPTNCDFCPPDHRTLCVQGRCEMPPTLEVGDVQEVGFQVEGSFFTELRSLVGVVMAQQSSGGVRLTCDDVIRSSFDLSGSCLNVMTSRLITISQGGQTFTFTFGSFGAGVEVLLLVYGFGDSRASTTPLGVTCTPHVSGAPGTGPVRLFGAPMRAPPP